MGNELQAFVTTTNAAWKALPSGSNDKYTGAQRDKIRDWVNEMIALRTKYSLPSVTLENYLNGQNFSPLPSTASVEDRTRDGQLIRSAAALRASAQGIYIHNEVNRYCGRKGFSYSTVGVDVTVAADTGKGYVERRYEILRDTEGCWQRHYRETMNTVSWRAIVYN